MALRRKSDYSLGSATLTLHHGIPQRIITAPSDFDAQGVAAEFVQIFQVGQFSSEGGSSPRNCASRRSGKQTVDYTAGLFYSSYSAETGYAPGGGFFVGTYDLPPTPFMPPPFRFYSVRSSAHLDGHHQQVRGRFRSSSPTT